MSYQTDPNREMRRSFCIYDILQFFTHLLYIASCRVGFVFLRLCTGRVCTKLVYQALCFPFQYIKVARRQSQLHSLQQAASSNSGARHVPCRNSSADVGSGARHWNAGQDGSKFVIPNEEHIDKNCTYMFLTHFDHGYLIYIHIWYVIWPLKLSDLRCCSLLTLRMLGLDEVSQMWVLYVPRTYLEI